jgi:E3 ubiquitin-protein ligase HUWE1
METTSQVNHNSLQVDHVEPYNVIPSYGGSEAVTDDMEHDQDFDGGFAATNEDEYMHETAEDARGREDGIENAGLRFEIQPHGHENLDDDEDDEDDEDDMSGVDGEDVDEDDEEHNDFEEDDVHHLPHPDTDQDDHDGIDPDEIDSDYGAFLNEFEEGEDEDDEDEDGVILRLEEGINGINVFDHIEVFGRENNFPNEALHVMPVEVFGSRRPGRTTSIYNLLGRTGDNSTPSRHPLLVGPSSSFQQSTGQSGLLLNEFLSSTLYYSSVFI